MDLNFIHDFNNLVNNIESVSFAEKSLIENRLKLIPEQLNLDISSIEANLFISNIHKVLIQSCDVKSELLWTIIDILTKLSSQNEWVEKLAIEYKFPFVLVKLTLSLMDATDGHLLKVLRLLHSFTFVEPVKYLEQPYLEAIITFLLDKIQNRNDDVSLISLSVLVNICNKNENASYILSKKVNSTTFAIQHKNHGILSYKIFIILEGISTLKAKDIQEFLTLSFEDIKNAVKTFDSLTIEHCLDSFMSLKDVKDVNLKIQNRNISDDLASLLQILMESLPPSGSSETKSVQNFFYIRVLKILDCLLTLDPSLCSLLDDFLKMCLENVTNYDRTFYSSLSNLLATYFKCEVDNPKELVGIIFDIFIPFAVKFHLNNKNVCTEDIAFWRFLSSIVTNLKSDREKIFELVNNEFFDLYFNDLVDYASVEIDLSDRKVMAYIEGIKTLADFSQNCPKLFFAKLEETIRLKPVVMLLAKGHLLGDANVITTIFELSKLPEFPMKQVAEMIIHQRKISELTKLNGKSDNNEIEVFRTNQIYELLADNTKDLISKIKVKLESNQNICSSEIVALYECKNNFANDMIKNLNDNLKRASENYVKLMQQMTNFSDVIKKQDEIHFKTELKNERLTNELKTMEGSMQALKQSLVNFQNKIDSKDRKCSTLQKSLDVKSAEIHELQNEKTELLKNYNEKVKKFEEMKNSLKESEKDLKDAQKKLSSYEAEESQQKEKILSLEKEISKSNKIVSSLQSELAKKQEQLDQYEIELKESEAMRQTIMNLMSGSKNRSKK